MKQTLKSLVLACGVLFFAASCSDKSQTTSEIGDTETETSAKPGSANSRMIVLSDSLQNNWQRMSESDQRKMASIRRLLDEISYTPKFNSLRQRQLLQLHEKAKTLQFDVEGMKNSEAIDKYDAAQDSLVNSTLNLAAETPDAGNYPLINELTSDIQQEHNKTILFRIRHDEFARDINKLMIENKNLSPAAPYNNLTKIPLFSLSGV